MKKKMGRPKLKLGEAKTFQCGLRFTPAEFMTIKTAVARDGFGVRQLSAWMRFVLLDYVRSTTEPIPKHFFKTLKGRFKPNEKMVGFGAERIRYIAKPD